VRALHLFALVAIVSCAPAAPGPKTIIATPRSNPAIKPMPVEQPARFALTPDDRWRAHARVSLSSGETLWVGDGSERWLVGPDGKNPRAAPRLVPGSFVGAARTDSGLVFLDDRGRLHEAKQALDPFVSMRAAPKPARVAAMGKKAMLVVTRDNELLRSTDLGASWTKAALPSFDGAMVDLAFSMQGFGILLAMPERVLKTEDDGVTWAFVGAKQGVRRVEVSEAHGPGLVDRMEEETHYDWSIDPEKQPLNPFGETKAPKIEKTIVSGNRRFELVSLGDAHWSLSSADLGSTAKHAHMKLLDPCQDVTFGVHEQVVEIACVAPSKNKPLDAKDLRLFRSEDQGATFTADGVFPWSADSVVMFVGPHGFLHLEGDECHGHAVASPDVCEPTWVRPSVGHPLVELPDRGKTRYIGERMIAQGEEVLALAVSFERKQIELHRIPLDGSTPERLGAIGPDEGWLYYARLARANDGTIVTATRMQTAIVLRKSTDGGRTFVMGASIPHGRIIELSGRRALAIDDDDRAFESTDAGVHFDPVGYPARAELFGCGTHGCATSRGDRIGWELGSPITKPATPPVRHAIPIRCTTTGPFATETFGNPPLPFAIDPTPDVRWAVPMRGGDSSMRLSIARVNEKGTQIVDVPLLGAATTDPAKRSQTFALSQPQGVVAVRYTYVRKKGGTFNPVDVELAWYRWSTGKVTRASLPSVPPFRVTHDPKLIGEEPAAWSEDRPIVSLASSGVWFAPFDGKIRFLADSGKNETFDDKTQFESHTFGVERIGKDLALVQMESDDGDVRVLLTKGYSHPQVWTLFRRDEGVVHLFPSEVGGMPGLQVTWPGSSSIPAATWTIALEAKSTPELVRALPNAGELEDPPVSCDATLLAKGARRIQPWTVGSRRPLVVTIDGVEHALASNVGIARRDKNASCTSAIHAVTAIGNDIEHEIVIAPHDLAHGTLFRVDRKTWPSKLMTRPITCTLSPGPLPKALEGVEGFVAND